MRFVCELYIVQSAVYTAEISASVLHWDDVLDD